MVDQIKQAWYDNKFMLSVLGIVLAGLMSWGVWVTHGVYVGSFNQERVIGICADVDKMKTDMESLKLKMDIQSVKFDTQILKAETNQIEILRNQNEIMKVLNMQRAR